MPLFRFNESCCFKSLCKPTSLGWIDWGFNIFSKLCYRMIKFSKMYKFSCSLFLYFIKSAQWGIALIYNLWWVVTWMSMQGMLTSLLGNLSLLSYFAKKREKEAMVVQTLGVVSTYVVLVQLALAETMPLPYFLATSVVVASGLFLNFMNFFGLLNAGIWRFWEDFITIGGLSVLPQVIVLSFSRPSINRIRTFYQYLFILLGTDQAYQFTNTCSVH